MNGNKEWKLLEKTWKDGTAMTIDAVLEGRRVRATARLAGWKTWFVTLAVLGGMAVTTLMFILHRSVVGYTFTVIGWSAVLALTALLLFTLEKPGDLAMETTAALGARRRKLEKRSLTLEFGQILVGVETLISAVFWVAIHARAGMAPWPGMAVILIAGVAGFAGLSWGAARVRRELKALETAKIAMERDE